jgi:hypothetical protein
MIIINLLVHHVRGWKRCILELACELIYVLSIQKMATTTTESGGTSGSKDYKKVWSLWTPIVNLYCIAHVQILYKVLLRMNMVLLVN